MKVSGAMDFVKIESNDTFTGNYLNPSTRAQLSCDATEGRLHITKCECHLDGGFQRIKV